MKRTKLFARAATGALGLIAAASAHATEPPPFRPDRTAEDYAYLGDPARHGDWSDPYKYVALADDGGAYLSLGGEIRERLEIFDSPRFGLGGGNPDTYVLQRVLVHGDLHLGPVFRVFAQIGAYEAFGKEQLMPPDEDHLDIQQLFFELRPVTGLSARVGRQEMIFNPTARFVSFRDGTNVRQNFDGARLTWNRGPLRVEGFLTRPVMLERDTFDDGRNLDQMFAGVYASHRLGPAGQTSVDGFWFMLDRDNLAAGPLRGRERRHSFGLRFAGADGPLDWDAEGIIQSGDSIGRDIHAWAASVDLGYAFQAAPLKPRLGLRFDTGSGDSDPGDGVAGGFYPLFPNGAYFNEANLTSWTNLLAIRPSLRVQPEPRLTLQAAIQFKWREAAADAVYIGPSAPLAATLGNNSREIGQVYTLDGNFQLNRNLALRAYYLHHSDGDAISAAGGGNVDFVMASATLRF